MLLYTDRVTHLHKKFVFLENVRSGEDIFWREKLVNNIFIKYYSPDIYYLFYIVS